MSYILGLILMLGFIFSSISGTNFVGSLWDQLISKISGFAFPKTQNEIVIENLETQYSNLNKLISSVAPPLLGSDAVSSQDKDSIKQAVQIIEESQNTIKQLKNPKKDVGSIAQSLIKKAFDSVPLPKQEPSPDSNPAGVPPNCN